MAVAEEARAGARAAHVGAAAGELRAKHVARGRDALALDGRQHGYWAHMDGHRHSGGPSEAVYDESICIGRGDEQQGTKASPRAHLADTHGRADRRDGRAESSAHRRADAGGPRVMSDASCFNSTEAVDGDLASANNLEG